MTPRLLLLALACLGAVQVPTFRARVESVRLEVQVTRDGRPVADLTADDFEVLDNGVRQRIDHVSLDTLPLNVVFAIDASYSVEGERAERLREACRAVLADLRKDDQAGLVAFGDPVIVRSPLTRDLPSVAVQVGESLPPGLTSLVDAVQAAILLGESEPGRALVIMFSDGIDVSSYLSPDAVVETAKRSEAVIYGVALRGVSRPGFMKDVAGASGGDFFEIEEPRDIEPTFKRVLDEFRRRYLLSYTPTGVDRPGWHRLQVRVKQRGASVKARPGYFRQ